MKSVKDYLEGSPEERELLELLYGWSGARADIFMFLLRTGEEMTVDELSKHVERERSTVYRAAENLTEESCVEKTREPVENGGYRKVYSAPEEDEIEQDMKLTVGELEDRAIEQVEEVAQQYDSETV